MTAATRCANDPKHTWAWHANVTRNAQLAGDAAASRNLADQHERLAALAAEGSGVVGELVDLVKIRDAQVKAQKGQISADGALLGRALP